MSILGGTQADDEPAMADESRDDGYVSDEGNEFEPPGADDDLLDAIAAVVADELCAQLHVRREPRQIADLVADELLRCFVITPIREMPDPSLPDDWPVVRHITVDRADQAHVEVATFPSRPRETEEVTCALPGGGRVSVQVELDGTVSEILLWPASRLLPEDVREEGPRPTSAADAE